MRFRDMTGSTTESARIFGRKLRAGDCVNRNLGGQWNNIEKCLLDTMSDCVGKFEKRARKPWITQEMISKMDEGRKWTSVSNEAETTED
jgi:hypothetical protein